MEYKMYRLKNKNDVINFKQPLKMDQTTFFPHIIWDKSGLSLSVNVDFVDENEHDDW